MKISLVLLFLASLTINYSVVECSFKSALLVVSLSFVESCKVHFIKKPLYHHHHHRPRPQPKPKPPPPPPPPPPPTTRKPTRKPTPKHTYRPVTDHYHQFNTWTPAPYKYRSLRKLKHPSQIHRSLIKHRSHSSKELEVIPPSASSSEESYSKSVNAKSMSRSRSEQSMSVSQSDQSLSKSTESKSMDNSGSVSVMEDSNSSGDSLLTDEKYEQSDSTD